MAGSLPTADTQAAHPWLSWAPRAGHGGSDTWRQRGTDLGEWGGRVSREQGPVSGCCVDQGEAVLMVSTSDLRKNTLVITL